MKPGDLTVGGFLYEGCDYDAWRARVNASCRVLDDAALETVGEKFVTIPFIARTYVCESIGQRLSEEAMRDLALFRGELQRLSRPFRLLDLPPEVVENIMLRSMQPNGAVDVQCLRRRLPPITQVCRQLRTISRRLYFSTRSFNYDLTFWTTTETLSHHVRRWADRLVGSDLASLRSFTLTRHWRRPASLDKSIPEHVSKTFTFTFSPTQGLQIKSDPALTPKSQQKLDAYVAKVNWTAQLLKLQGQSIFLAIMQEPDRWLLTSGLFFASA